MIVIIGNGIAGVTAARHIRKRSDEEIMIISSESKYFYARTALMYVYMGHMRFNHIKPYEDWFWEKNRIQLLQAHVDKIDFSAKILGLDNRQKIPYSKLILAVGSKSNKFGWPGQDLKGVGCLYSYQDLQNMETYTKGVKQAVVVGGGLIGIEMAEMLRSRDIDVKFLIREAHFWSNVLNEDEAKMIEAHIREHEIELLTSTELDSIIPDSEGKVSAIITKTGDKIPCQWVGLTTGVSPNVDFLKDSELKINRGIIVDQYFRTNIEDVYAIGDCAEFETPAEGRRPIEQIWYTGKIMGEALAKTITGENTPYKPGPWYNSAKFIDIEYQNYGNVPSKLNEYQRQFYWQDNSGKKSMRFVFSAIGHRFLGVNSFGIRLRHASFHEFITKERTIEYVLKHLRDANFDPEFSKKYEDEIIARFNLENDTDIQPKKFSWKRLLAYNS